MSTGMTRLSTRILKEANSSAVAPPPEELPGESDFVVILAAMLCALICVVGLIAVARCAWLRRGGASPQPPPSRAANRGLKKKVVESLPKFTYTAGSDKFTSSQECAICLGEFVEGDEIRVLPKCRHEFHVRCIDRWLGSHSSCPSCRQLLVVARCNKCGGYPAVETCGITPTGDPNANSHAHGSRTFFLP